MRQRLPQPVMTTTAITTTARLLAIAISKAQRHLATIRNATLTLKMIVSWLLFLLLLLHTFLTVSVYVCRCVFCLVACVRCCYGCYGGCGDGCCCCRCLSRLTTAHLGISSFAVVSFSYFILFYTFFAFVAHLSQFVCVPLRFIYIGIWRYLLSLLMAVSLSNPKI